MRAAAAAALLAAACTAPEFGDGHLECAAAAAACPDGFYCAADQHCWRQGSGPPLADLATLGADLATADLAPGGDLASNPSRCALGTFKLCDGFENPVIDGSTWQVHMTNGSVTLDPTFAFRGHSSLKLHHDAVTTSTGGQANAAILESGTFPITGTIYARAYFYFPTAVAPAVAQLINLVDSSGYGVSYVIDHGHPGLNDYAPPTAYSASAVENVPRGAWTCLQIQVPQTAATGDIHIFVDGTEVDTSLTGAQTPPITQLFFSLYYYQPPMLAAEDVWLDEVIVDDKPISCAD
ncbi:MAG TPA: hypothetical protein VFF06_30400 [Polyangia bacterium]|nr:hypothetical protein [Polyangia bacterium]